MGDVENKRIKNEISTLSNGKNGNFHRIKNRWWKNKVNDELKNKTKIKKGMSFTQCN